MSNTVNNITEEIKDLLFPIKIGLRNRSEGMDTTARISVRAEIKNKIIPDFEDTVISVINDREKYIGPKELSQKIIKYLEDFETKSIEISFKFPFFYKKLKEPRNNMLSNYACEYKVNSERLKEFQQSYKVEIPLIFDQYLIPGILKEVVEVPAKIIVDAGVNETIFIEDIIETVDWNMRKKEYFAIKDSIKKLFSQESSEITLLKNIKNDLYKKNDIKWCRSAIVKNRMTYIYSMMEKDGKCKDGEKNGIYEYLNN